MPDYQNIRTSTENRDALRKYKLRVAAAIGRDFGMGELIGILVTVGEQHHADVIRIARERIK